MRAGDVRRVSAVVLTMGDRPDELVAACRSLTADDAVDDIVVVFNGTTPVPMDVRGVEAVELAKNVGVPAGRHTGLSAARHDVVIFLDDDARLLDPLGPVIAAFDGDQRRGVIALRLVDESGASLPRHVPRLLGRNADRSGPVATFLGGACAVRRTAYEAAGGSWGDLFYGHEEVELSWRLVDRSWSIRYDAETRVLHPHTGIERHPDGWRLTGANRVRIARRSLPWPVAVLHAGIWLAVGAARAPSRAHRAAYLRGWWSGWRADVARSPIGWRTVFRLLRLGRPPIA